MERVYRFDPNPRNTRALLLSEVPEGSRVLEIGAASGYMGEYLIEHKKCEVWGVEPVKELYEDASHYGYTKLFNTGAEAFLAMPEVAAEKFDVIFMGDVLEHMVQPDDVLTRLRSLLKPGGRVVISLPNIAHYTTRWQLLTGRFDMKESGIMDRTHLHFFTLKTMREMIEKSGFTIQKVRPSSGNMEEKLLGFGKTLLFNWPTLFAVQFIFVATPK